MSDPRPDDLVIVAYVPNVPIAEMIIGELRNEGIEAFYKPAGTGPFSMTSVTGPAGPCDIYVQQADAQRAKELLPPQ
jgi:hypothetical protein